MNRIAVVCLLAGFALVVVGATLVFHPLGYLTAGAGLIYASLRASPKRSK